MRYAYNKNKVNIKLLIAGQIALGIGALFGAISLFIIAMPLNRCSWALTLTAAGITALAMLFAVILLIIAPEKRF